VTSPRRALAVSSAAATLAVLLAVIAAGGVLRAGLAPRPGTAVVATATAAYVLSREGEAFPVAGLLAASGLVGLAYGLVGLAYGLLGLAYGLLGLAYGLLGLVGLVYGLLATGLLAAARCPGPALGVIIGLPVLGLGVAKGVTAARAGRRWAAMSSGCASTRVLLLTASSADRWGSRGWWTSRCGSKRHGSARKVRAVSTRFFQGSAWLLLTGLVVQVSLAGAALFGATATTTGSRATRSDSTSGGGRWWGPKPTTAATSSPAAGASRRASV
jgi:hypothetical protein